jgi:hypothetical protein
MRFAYADPPYLGCAVRLYGDHPEAAVYDTVAGHAALIERLGEFDGWALSMTSGNLRELLPLCPAEARVMAWVKPFASFKPNVPVAYAWEPVIVKGGRKRDKQQDTVRDWCAANITMQKGLPGAKPREFCNWIFSVLNVHPGDDLVDLFPGSGNVGAAWEAWQRQRRLFA